MPNPAVAGVAPGQWQLPRRLLKEWIRNRVKTERQQACVSGPDAQLRSHQSRKVTRTENQLYEAISRHASGTPVP